MLNGLTNSLQGHVENSMKFLGLDNGWLVWLALVSIFGIIIIASLISFWLVRNLLLRFIKKIIRKNKYLLAKFLYKHNVFNRLAALAPGFVVYITIPIIEITQLPVSSALSGAIGKLSVIYIVGVIAAIFSAFLNAFESRYLYFTIAKRYSIKTYIQVIKIILFGLASIFAIAVLLGKSPVYLLTGLGAMTAVIMLVFKDSILGFVASIQLSAYDMLRIGDWVEVSNYGANGTVIDISLSSVKVQNFDNTFVTIPTYAFLTNGVKNWRGMSSSGARRIKRPILIDVNTVKFCNADLLTQLARVPLLKNKIDEIASTAHPKSDSVVAELLQADTKCVTNLSLYRMYLEDWIRAHPKVNLDKTFMIRELDPIGQGVPLEIYMFSNDVDWVRFEDFQSEIFDYCYAVMQIFELRCFQHDTGARF